MLSEQTRSVVFPLCILGIFCFVLAMSLVRLSIVCRCCRCCDDCELVNFVCLQAANRQLREYGAALFCSLLNCQQFCKI